MTTDVVHSDAVDPNTVSPDSFDTTSEKSENESDLAEDPDQDETQQAARTDGVEAPDSEELNERGEIRLPEGIDYYNLDRDVRASLRSLPKGLAESVGKRILAAGELLDVDPRQALAHALVARRMTSRIAMVREAAGIAAYRAGEWQMAIGELRTAQRLSGNRNHVAMIADSERALGRPERAIDAYRELDPKTVDPEVRIELLIVAAGARRDLDQTAAAVAMLQVPELKSQESWSPRLWYAYADALAEQGRTAEAREWFTKVTEVDPDDELGAAERLLDLDGVAWVAEPDESQDG